ncbi:hypothetical protein Cst_c04980 [Thermoclostridium stercorarium subsp. stercorarium DSM 8532]|uniref:Uncharacterized protein n=1 Tax=Thermoclostridium stercorarium (strain ATCC 35414 / DSM 8532 / NCIMB 11754) TaxID=1121335 RepID=L7VHK0_THES1|nr:hypothetical protein Cst_c04980 [Thermoclostridium stercorarium subsp. stercorarium DSM 8532]
MLRDDYTNTPRFIHIPWGFNLGESVDTGVLLYFVLLYYNQKYMRQEE